MNELNRRNFFNRISISALGTLLFSVFPLNVFGKSKSQNVTKVNVKIHPSSVKRNRKGS